MQQSVSKHEQAQANLAAAADMQVLTGKQCQHKRKQRDMRQDKNQLAGLVCQPAGQRQHQPLTVGHGIQFMGKQQGHAQIQKHFLHADSRQA